MAKFILCSIISFLLFSSTGFALYPFKEICSSSCGTIEKILPPFRLKGDPHYCGSPDYELSCEGNTTILSLSSGKYYVTNLSFDPNELHVVDIGLASGNCRLPLGSISPRTIKQRYQTLPSTSWVSFVNCTDNVRHDEYHPVSCLSQYRYVTSGYQVKELLPSCGFVAMIPTIGFINGSSNADLFEQLRMGFGLSWIDTRKTFGYCLIGYLSAGKSVVVSYQAIGNLVLIELGFLDCVYESKDTKNLPIAIAFVVVLNCLLITLIRVLILAPVCVWAFLGYEYFKVYVLSVDAIEKFLRNQRPLAPTRYPYNDIVKFTNHFEEKLGQGGFGVVFKGKLPDGQLVAVKMLKHSQCEGEQFINEVATLGSIHHVNVVHLVGFCSEGSKRALIYEYLRNGSLDEYIFTSVWEKINDIALGVARGIDYLHQGCDKRILHFDIKPQNILLDDDFTPKVSDFGLAKLYPKDYDIVGISVARGTIGYIAPELVSRNFGVISHKSDVYSYGMLLLEMAGRRRKTEPDSENASEVYYPSWVYDQLNKLESTKFDDMAVIDEVERKLLEMINDVERKICKVGLWCIQMKASDRPAMSRVIEMLEADVNTLPMPPKPFFSMTPQQGTLIVGQSCSDSSLTESSITEEYE